MGLALLFLPLFGIIDTSCICAYPKDGRGGREASVSTALGDLQIVPMGPEHLSAIADLEQVCFSHPWSRKGLAQELVNPNASFFAAELGSPPEVAGYLGMHHVLDEGYIANVAVFPKHRRKGVASALLCHLVEYARALSLSFLTLEVRASNQAAISLYTALGFAKAGVRPGFYQDPAEDAWIMTLYLL